MLFEENLELLAAVESLDNGKALSLAKIDVGMAASCLRYYGGWADKIEGKTIDTGPDSFNNTTQEPVGVFALYCITVLIYSSRLVSVAKSFHGTFLSSFLLGRSVLPLRWVTQSLSKAQNKLLSHGSKAH